MKVLHPILSLFFAFLVLLSSTSFMIGIHYCMGEVEEVALFSKADGCAMERSMPLCHQHLNMPCCEDETVVHQASDLKIDIKPVDISASPAVLITRTDVVIAEILPADGIQSYGDHYDPPLPSSDRTIQLQVFRI